MKESIVVSEERNNFLSSTRVRRGPKEDGGKDLLAIPEVFVPVDLQLVLDHPTAGHPGRN
ncbi:hypothetical protein E2C01_074226 [Portunus trituberculatus]|uniref:Uncharacterized protein n=1 Tax=Portunus trituberculatus TaxID=210409 RepID=A0A5B7IBU3_PORTR|nr:hypothetical protein [Portunus trituberculatus]